MLDFAQRNFGGDAVSWADTVAPAIRYASEGFVVGPFQHRSFRNSIVDLIKQDAAGDLFVRTDGIPHQIGDIFRNPKLAATLRRIAANGAMNAYRVHAIADNQAASIGSSARINSHSTAPIIMNTDPVTMAAGHPSRLAVTGTSIPPTIPGRLPPVFSMPGRWLSRRVARIRPLWRPRMALQ